MYYDLEAEVADRSGWSMDGEVAVYAPDAAEWCARIRHTIEPVRLADRWHVWCCDPSHVARYALVARTPFEAVQWAEGVIARQEIAAA